MPEQMSLMPWESNDYQPDEYDSPADEQDAIRTILGMRAETIRAVHTYMLHLWNYAESIALSIRALQMLPPGDFAGPVIACEILVEDDWLVGYARFVPPDEWVFAAMVDGGVWVLPVRSILQSAKIETADGWKSVDDDEPR